QQDENERQKYMETMKDMKQEEEFYIDQSGIDRREVYEYGWGVKGERVYGKKVGRKRERVSMMGGYYLGRLVEPLTWIGNCNLQVVLTWLREWLLPAIGRGKKIVLDNASFHRSSVLKQVVEAAGCELFTRFESD
ncbi:MAG: transposase, partial [Gloeomargarita sp. SKYG98]|nr:transposase [Gloeomargarita sp. SKYG98]